MILLDLLDGNRGLGGLLDNRSLLGNVKRKLVVVLLEHCDRGVLVLGSSAFELRDTVELEDDVRTQKRRKRTPTPHLGGESSSRFSD